LAAISTPPFGRFSSPRISTLTPPIAVIAQLLIFDHS
jgi:hypothetical protein